MYVHLLLNIYAVENDSNKFLMAPFPLQDNDQQESFIYTEYSIFCFNRIHRNVHYLFIRPLNKYLLNAYHMQALS